MTFFFIPEIIYWIQWPPQTVAVQRPLYETMNARDLRFYSCLFGQWDSFMGEWCLIVEICCEGI